MGILEFGAFPAMKQDMSGNLTVDWLEEKGKGFFYRRIMGERSHKKGGRKGRIEQKGGTALGQADWDSVYPGGGRGRAFLLNGRETGK